MIRAYIFILELIYSIPFFVVLLTLVGGSEKAGPWVAFCCAFVALGVSKALLTRRSNTLLEPPRE